jgi:4-hydroxybenzoate polyprenyltransferase
MLAVTSRVRLYLDLIRWSRPAGTWLLLWPTLTALWLAAGGFPGWHLLAVFALGTFLMRSAGCAVNDVADREFDRHVKRTAQRPVTQGAVSVREAVVIGALLALMALGLVLSLRSTALLAWSMAAVAITVAYPYTKRFLAMPQAVLGVAFSLGIPMAFVAVQGHVPMQAAWLFAGNLCWVLAYDTAYAMVDRDDDLRLGLNTSAITLGRFDVAGVMLFYVAALAAWWVMGHQLGLGWPYFAALAVAAGWAGWYVTLVRTRSREGCWRAFRANHWLGFTLFAGVWLALPKGF